MNKNLRNSSAVNTMKILEEIAQYRDGISLKDLSKNTDLNKSTAYRFVETLCDLGYVEQDLESKKYYLGNRAYILSYSITSKYNWRKEVHKCLLYLRNIFDETVHLGILDGNEVAYVDKVESMQSIRMYSRVGNKSPLYCTGIGKAILANMPDDFIKNYLENIKLTRYTSNTITDKEGLEDEIRKIRKCGYAMDQEEHEEGVVCAAVPVVSDNKLIGAISISGPNYRINDEKLDKMAKKMKECTENLNLIYVEGESNE